MIGKINEDQLIQKIKKIEATLNREINYHLYLKKDFIKKFKENSFLQNIIKNYIILTNNQDEFEQLLKSIS